MPFLVPVLPFIPAAAAVVGVGLQIASTVQSTSAAMSQADYQKGIAERNVAISNENAGRTTYRAQVEQQTQDEAARSTMGSIVAEQGASGIRINSRSSILTRQSARALARFDAANIRQAGDVEAHNYLMSAADSAEAAKFAGQTSQNALTAGFISGASALVGGASSLLTKFPTATDSLVGGRKMAGAAVPAPRTLRFAS